MLHFISVFVVISFIFHQKNLHDRFENCWCNLTMLLFNSLVILRYEKVQLYALETLPTFYYLIS